MLTATTFLRRHGTYLWVVFLAPPLTIFGHALAPGRAVFKGHDLGVLAGLALAAVSLLLWLPYRSTTRLTWLPTTFLGVLGATWLLLITRIQLDQSLFALTAFTVPVFVALIIVKPPRATDVRTAGLVLAYGLAGIALVSIPLSAVGAMPTGFDTALCRLPIICDLTGGLPRWAGPFGNVNYSAPIGGLLIVFGAAQQRVHAWLIAGSGVVIIVLSQGRSGLFAVVVGLAILVLWGRRVSASPKARAIRVTALVLLVVGAVVFILAVDPTVNGRTGIWGEFIELWRTEPWTGVGDSGIKAYIASRPDVPTFDHAHSVLLDLLVRWGPLMLATSVAIYVLAMMAGVRGLRGASDPGPLAIVAFVISAGLVETIHSWDYWTPYVAMLTWAVLLATPRPGRAPLDGSREGLAQERNSLS
ncbi:MAG: O-antigen ligase family protein [Candidatus Nanopelagicales bacterium]